MSGISGKKARVKVATLQAGPYTAVAGVDQISAEIDGTAVDDSEFGVDWSQALQGLKHFKVSLTGKFRPADTNGQLAIRNALINDGPLFVQFLPDNGVTANVGLQCAVTVTKFAGDTGIDADQKVSIDLEGNGAVTLI